MGSESFIVLAHQPEVASAFDIVNGHFLQHVLFGVCTHDGRWFSTIFHLCQYVAIECKNALHLTPVECLIIDFFAQFECDFEISNGVCRLQGVRIVGVFD